MRRARPLRGLVPLALLAVALGSTGTGAPAAPGPVSRDARLVEPYPFPIDFNHFYDYEDMAATMQAVAERFPDLTDLRSIGRSRGGRDLWMMRITDESTEVHPDRKPAIYVDGNIHGNEVQATEVCLYVIHTLVNGHERDPYVTRLLRDRTFYLVPSVNPDSRAAFFAEPNSPHSPRQNLRPYDNDMDGRVDEDGPNDLDGDGSITFMRKKDPYGTHVTGDDPRDTDRRALDEDGEWSLYWWEGIDDDGDGRLNEDWVGGVDMNRNFPADWQPWAVQWGSGPYPMSEPEIRAVAEFVLDHPNIAALQSFHNSGNLILYPYGARSAQDLPSRDRQVYEAIAERGREILLDYDPGSIRDDLYSVWGSTVDFGYIHHGAISFTNELWAFIVDYDGDGSISMAERLRWSDERLDGEAWKEWTPYDHPDLGEVEIGGWTQFHSRMPPVGYLAELCRLNADFVLFHADAMPKLAVTRTEITEVAPGVVALDVFVANDGIMDTYPRLSVDLDLATPVVASIRVADGVTLLEGGERPRERAMRARTHDPVDRRKPDPARVELGQIEGKSETAIRWLLSAPSGAWAEITVEGDKAGVARSGRISLTP